MRRRSLPRCHPVALLRRVKEHPAGVVQRGKMCPPRRARSVARRKPRSSPICRLNEARKPSTTSSDGPVGRGTNRSGPKRCAGNALGLIRLPSVPFLGAFSVGIARKRPRPAPDHRTLVKRANDLRRFGVNQARSVELPVRVVLIVPAVRQPLAQPGAGHLPAELGLRPRPASRVPLPPRARCRAARPAYSLAASA